MRATLPISFPMTRRPIRLVSRNFMLILPVRPVGCPHLSPDRRSTFLHGAERLPPTGTSMTTAARTLAYPPNPSYGAGTCRRRILLRQEERQAFASLDDNYPEMT